MSNDDITPAVVTQLGGHRRRHIPVASVKEGDLIHIAGWPAVVRFSEPWSDYIWQLDVAGFFRDGDPFTTAVKIPADTRVDVRRKPGGNE